MNVILAFQGILFACGATVFVASLRFVRRLLELRHERSLRAPTDDLSKRIQRIEAIVESTAIEVERISEANRFMARLLADRVPSAGVVSRPPGRVITPH